MPKTICPINDANLAHAADILRRGGLVAFPTETVYGLGANALDATAVARIYEVKRRPLASPLIVHVSSKVMARSLTSDWPDAAHQLVNAFWPGPLTLVLKKAEAVPSITTAGLDSVGVRMPDHPVALDLIRLTGLPVAAPSANLFTQISPTTAEHVYESLGDAVDLILDGGACSVGIESTVASLRRVPPAVLRPGMISMEQLETVTSMAWEREQDVPHIVESPGQHPRHYAPRTPFFVLEETATLPEGKGRILELPSDARLYAANLYSVLRAADREGWEWIAVTKPSETSEWTGILDRLRRASQRE